MSHTAQVNGLRMAYDDTGPAGAPVVLLVHGFPLGRWMWDAQRDAVVAAGYRLIAPDLRGFGDTDATPPPYSMDGYADDLAALLDTLGVARVVLGGLSMGGYVAFAFWRRHASRVGALLLADTRHTPDTPEARQNRYRAIEQVRHAGVRSFTDTFTAGLVGATTKAENPALLDAVRARAAAVPANGVIGALGALAERPDSTPTLATITVPTLILVGAEDTLAPPSVHEEMGAAIAGSRVVTVPAAGHLSPMEAPAAFNTALGDFLAGVRIEMAG
ncbi:MAG: alpha/beta fold hydrolase [Anaerolineae bacterium]